LQAVSCRSILLNACCVAAKLVDLCFSPVLLRFVVLCCSFGTIATLSVHTHARMSYTHRRSNTRAAAFLQPIRGVHNKRWIATITCEHGNMLYARMTKIVLSEHTELMRDRTHPPHFTSLRCFSHSHSTVCWTVGSIADPRRRPRARPPTGCCAPTASARARIRPSSKNATQGAWQDSLAAYGARLWCVVSQCPSVSLCCRCRSQV
jgi:hypothetical protein